MPVYSRPRCRASKRRTTRAPASETRAFAKAYAKSRRLCNTKTAFSARKLGVCRACRFRERRASRYLERAARLAALALSRSKVLATSTTKRVWLPAPICSISSFASSSNVTRRPSTRFYRRGNFNLHVRKRRREMAHRDLDADRIFAVVGVLHQKIAAGVLHVAHQARRRVDAALFAHEANGAVAIDGKTFDVGNSRTKALLHFECLPAAYGPA